MLKLIDAGYNRQEIEAFQEREQSEPQAAADQQQVNDDHQDPKPEDPQSQSQPDISALVAEEVRKAMQLVNVHSSGVEEPDHQTPEQALFEGVFGPAPK